MMRHIVERFVRLIFTLFIVSIIIFIAVQILPGDVATTIAGIDATDEELAAIRTQMGLDSPPLQRYFRWLGDIVRFDFGISQVHNRAVGAMIAERLPLTIGLAVGGLLLAMAIGISLGLYQGIYAGRLFDWGGALYTNSIIAIPEFWVGIVLALIFAVNFKWVPLFGIGTPGHYILPIVTLGLTRSAPLARITRTMVVQMRSKLFVVAAYGRGIPNIIIHWKYILYGVLPSIFTIAAIQFGYLIGGVIIIEQLFALPGLGRLFVAAAQNRDLLLLQGSAFIFTLIFSIANFVVDILHICIDSRMRQA